ncbi:CoA protein activase [Clostridiaceae bacterium M8S5]|nr:CoA protein activase [Clostridiaceae bacterium M8S5]
MKITFPHMGNAYIGAKSIIEDCGIDVIVPPKCSKKTLELGTKYSPETICLPLKINIGNYIESIKKGADTIIIAGCKGPCRFGLYSIIEEEILRDLGYDVKFLVIDAFENGDDGLLNQFGKLNAKQKFNILISFIKGKKIMTMADKLTALSNRKRAYTNDKREIDKIMDDYRDQIYHSKGSDKIMEIIKKTNKRLLNIKEDNTKNILEIGIVGEIYAVIEPFVNLEIERKLGYLDVLVHRYLSPSAWIENHVSIKTLFGSSLEKKMLKEASKYFKTIVGGHCRETVGSSIMYAKKKYDGIIQIYPFGCMPEIVAASVLPSISKEYNIPIMTLIVDEMSGEAGYITRIEAFVDLLRKRKEQVNNGKIVSRS